MGDTIDWNLYRIFLAVIDAGSLSAAARTLESSAPTVGRQIEALETDLGMTLFTRSPSGLVATSEAHDLVAHAQSMAAAANALRRAAGGTSAALLGTVRITASEMVGAEVLPSLLRGFHQQHPGIVVELALANRTEDLLRRDADIAVRMTEPSQSALLRKRVGQVEIGLYAHSSYARAHGLPASREALASHTLIGYDRDPFAQRMARAVGIEIRRDMFGLRSDSDLAQLALLRAGCGIGGCQVNVARRDPMLLPVLSDQIRFALPVWLVMHNDQRRVARIRAAFDYLAGGLAEVCAPQRAPARLRRTPRATSGRARP
jgi:DNA-binding transcriptional LysR family regulator